MFRKFKSKQIKYKLGHNKLGSDGIAELMSRSWCKLRNINLSIFYDYQITLIVAMKVLNQLLVEKSNVMVYKPYK